MCSRRSWNADIWSEKRAHKTDVTAIKPPGEVLEPSTLHGFVFHIVTCLKEEAPGIISQVQSCNDGEGT